MRLREVERYQRLAEQLAISPPEVEISPISPPELEICPHEIAPGIARRARTSRRARAARRTDQVLLAHGFGDRVDGVAVVLVRVRVRG